MALPTSGTYTVSVVKLAYKQSDGRFYTSDSQNVTANNVEAVFSGNSVQLGDPYNTTFSYNISDISEAPYNSSGNGYAVIRAPSGDNFTGFFIATTLNNIERTNIGQDSNDSTIFYYGTQTITQQRRQSNGNRIIYGDNFLVNDSCFLAGTLIKTPRGKVAVENLCVGDELLTYSEHGEPKVDIVTWAGKARTFVRQNLSRDEAGYPVRVLKDAIADGVPFKDLLITSEHCLFFDGMLIPARMLVNGSSIFYDTSFTSYEYFHIETEKHSVIMADGMLTESYLDTGNRRGFFQKENIPFLNIKTDKTWEKDAAAPLTTARDAVEPIFRQIEARAQDMKRPVITQPAVLTNDADIHLMTDKGKIIRPSRQNGNTFVFQLPEQTCSVRILSNTSRPCDIIGPFVDDRRKLGVLIGDIKVFAASKMINLTAHLQEKSLSGWHAIESSSMRWTSGNAELHLTQDSLSSKRIVSLQIVSAGPYLVSNELENIKAA